MDRSISLTLIAKTYTKDALNQFVPQETRKDIFGTEYSISGVEWFNAGRNGIKAQRKVVVFAPEYNGETIVELEGERYAVYRTYLAKNEQMELYLEEKAGI